MHYSESGGNLIAMKLDLNEVPYEAIESTWNRFSNLPLETRMLEQNFDELIYKEEQSANAVLSFTVLAIIISCLGLFGLAAFVADQRQHEFGIRKVLGASVKDVVHLFSLDFLKLIVLAFIISVPLAFWGVNVWLQGYADRIALTIDIFIIAGVLAIAIAFFTILFQSFKASRLSPTDSLRRE